MDRNTTPIQHAGDDGNQQDRPNRFASDVPASVRPRRHGDSATDASSSELRAPVEAVLDMRLHLTYK